ncbi:YfhE family protein [Bacillus sp. FJAT-22090]|nr:YfhE family protein [Bacillus sp. FJAT-22090]
MKDRKPPHEQLTMKNNGLTKTQEVLYQEEFKHADKEIRKKNQNKK